MDPTAARKSAQLSPYVWGVIPITLLVVLAFFAARYILLGHFFIPGTEYFVSIARRSQHIANSINEYRMDRGLLPLELQDLVPKYIQTTPSYKEVTYSNGILSIAAGLPHTKVCYSFGPGEKGWYVSGDYPAGPLPLPKIDDTPRLKGEELIKARLAEYDRRIANHPTDVSWYKNKITYLVSVGQLKDAAVSSEHAARSFPSSWWAMMAFASLAPAEEAFRAEGALRTWAASHPGFLHFWYLSRYYRNRQRDHDAIVALKDAVKYPLISMDLESDPLGYCAYDAANYAYLRGQYELALMITRQWAANREADLLTSADRYAVQAAAELALGQFDEAAKDIATLSRNGVPPAWVANVEQLQSAISSHEITFKFDPGKYFQWNLFSSPDDY